MSDPTMKRMMPQAHYEPDPLKPKKKASEPAVPPTPTAEPVTPMVTDIDAQLGAMLADAADPAPMKAAPEAPLVLVAPVVPKLQKRFVPTVEKLHPALDAPKEREAPMQVTMSDTPIEIEAPKVYLSQRTLDELEMGRKSIQRH